MLSQLWLFLMAVFSCTVASTLLPWSPGYALALNTRNNTEYAYSYPRRLSRAFTVEFWMRGNGVADGAFIPLSIAHPKDDNLVIIYSQIKFFNNDLLLAPTCPVNVWCHIAVSFDVTAFPAFSIRTYLNGVAAWNQSGVLLKTRGLTAAALEEETLAIVLGQEQDSQLGGFDPTQIFAGHIDEFRIWNAVRTPQEIQQAYGLSLATPYPNNLVSYYTFDSSEWGARYYQDQVNNSKQHRLYAADYSIPTAAAMPPPGYAPPAVPLARQAVSSAPVCSAAAQSRELLMRTAPGGSLAVPVAALACGAVGSARTMVTAVSGGTATADGQSAVSVALDSTRTLTFTAGGSGIAAGAGFNFTVTDASATVSGFVAVLPNSAPALPTSLALTGDEDTVVSSWLTVVDDDQDIVSVEIVVTATGGLAQLDGLINRTFQYTPRANAFGADLGLCRLQARDMWGAVSSTMLVTISIRPMADAPQLLMGTSFSIYRGQRLVLPFDVLDVDRVGPFVIVSDWPAASQGYLQGEDQGQVWTINDAMASSNVQWASGFGNYSSMNSLSEGNVSNSIAKITGPPECAHVYDTCTDAWLPSTWNANCANRASSAEAFFTFYTEFIEAKFASPMYLSAVILVEPSGGDRVSRVLVPSDRNSTQWKTLLSRDVANTPASSAVTRYIVESLSVCQTLWPVDRVRIEGDTCHRAGWWNVDAVQMRGGSVPPKNVLNATAKLSFTATPGYTGTVTFGLTATTCYGSFESTSQPLRIRVTVSDTPHVLTTVTGDKGSNVDVGQLAACQPRSGNMQVLELPKSGRLRYMDVVLTATLEDLGSPSTAFQYEPFQCDPHLRDSFFVQLGPTAVVQVDVHGCTTSGSQLVALVALTALVPLFLAGPGFAYWRQARHQRNNSHAPKDPERAIGVLFTDIQASTLLWGEMPELMAHALDVHHHIIRQAVHKYRCYEVKTIGDSFMVVSSDPTALLQLALSIQEALYDHDWGHEGFDVVYRRQTGCKMRADDYSRCWRGLRVRMGLHYGLAQIIFDETTKGYDYYGNVVNTAARIEGAAHGGQTLLSREAHDALPAHYADLNVHARSLGCVELCGLRAPLDLVQILPARFTDREFPPLRTDHVRVAIGSVRDDEAGMEDGFSSSNDRSGSGSTRERLYPQALERDMLTHPLVRSGVVTAEVAAFHAQSVFYTLRSHLNMLPTAEERRTRLREACRQWHVPCHAATEEQENGALGRLALQVMGSVVTQMHSKQHVHSPISQGIVSSPPLSPLPTARLPSMTRPRGALPSALSIIVLPSPEKDVHKGQVVPIVDSP